jgi:hypothetical protein
MKRRECLLGPMSAQVGRWRPKGARGVGSATPSATIGLMGTAKVDWVARGRHG